MEFKHAPVDLTDSEQYGIYLRQWATIQKEFLDDSRWAEVVERLSPFGEFSIKGMSADPATNTVAYRLKRPDGTTARLTFTMAEASNLQEIQEIKGTD